MLLGIENVKSNNGYSYSVKSVKAVLSPFRILTQKVRFDIKKGSVSIVMRDTEGEGRMIIDTTASRLFLEFS